MWVTVHTQIWLQAWLVPLKMNKKDEPQYLESKGPLTDRKSLSEKASLEEDRRGAGMEMMWKGQRMSVRKCFLSD